MGFTLRTYRTMAESIAVPFPELNRWTIDEWREADPKLAQVLESALVGA